ncbi:GntR family transcriptional regulator [Halonatronum saccharophilum]|uniref:GntR family transcriptional regulator n=1 Tax=Halonatronum saccharophilum TaxID=150060 RepID=UPI000487719C|nr:GntR family transcriptional regulator [Halonatronum saccharophilum]
MKKVTKDNPLPLYHQLKEILQEKIDNNILVPGDSIPTERELCEIHNISRMTARKAIMALVNEGLLYREQGKGTFVADFEPDIKYQLSKLKGFTETMEEKGLESTTKLLNFEIKSATKKIKKHLQMPEAEDDIIEVKRLRSVEGEPFALETAWLPYDLCFSIDEKLIKDNSLYNIFKRVCNYQLDYAKQTIEPTILNDYESDLLGVNSDQLALLFRRTTYIKNDRIIEYTKALYRSDRYKHELILSC